MPLPMNGVGINPMLLQALMARQGMMQGQDGVGGSAPTPLSATPRPGAAAMLPSLMPPTQPGAQPGAMSQLMNNPMMASLAPQLLQQMKGGGGAQPPQGNANPWSIMTPWGNQITPQGGNLMALLQQQGQALNARGLLNNWIP